MSKKLNKENFPVMDELLEAVEQQMFGLENLGFCLACGELQDGCEPDARNYTCDCCDEPMVFGAAECLLMGYYQ